MCNSTLFYRYILTAKLPIIADDVKSIEDNGIVQRDGEC